MTNIECQWMKDKLGLINYDGQVYPCCYLANNFAVKELLKDKFGNEDIIYGGADAKLSGITEINLTELQSKYEEHKSELNIMENSLEDILNHKWFTEILPKSWDNDNTTHRLCKRFCGKNKSENEDE